MQHRPGPLLHDYKSAASRPSKKSKALQWFAVGLGIPLAGLLFLSIADREPPMPPAGEVPVLVAAGEPTSIAKPAVSAPIDDDIQALIEPVIEPVPTYDSLSLTINRGDTLDKLFRKNDLNLGHLAAIAKLDEPRKLFRRLKPGDEFEI
ncbi:MAG: hypothetical protein KJO82_00790, partial [Gammaproteobacteria bacterium]|nr:hypothetical protein [Gammaproteobacteria bacterium]